MTTWLLQARYQKDIRPASRVGSERKSSTYNWWRRGGMGERRERNGKTRYSGIWYRWEAGLLHSRFEHLSLNLDVHHRLHLPYYPLPIWQRQCLHLTRHISSSTSTSSTPTTTPTPLYCGTFCHHPPSPSSFTARQAKTALASSLLSSSPLLLSLPKK